MAGLSVTKQKKRRDESVKRSVKEISSTIKVAVRDNLNRVRAISDEEWQAAIDGEVGEKRKGPGRGWWGPEKGGTHGKGTGTKLAKVPGHVFQRAGQRTGYKVVKAAIKQLKTSPVLPSSDKQAWHMPLRSSGGKLRGLLVGRDSYATTTLGPWGKPRKGSWEISLGKEG